MKKGKNNKKKVAVLAAGLAILTLTAGTFAWTSYTEWTKNHMQSKEFKVDRVKVVENFDTDKPINPNPNDPNAETEVTKEVKVTNASDTPAFVRVSLEEMLSKLADGAERQGKATNDVTSVAFPIHTTIEGATVNGAGVVTPEAGYTLISATNLIDKQTGAPLVAPTEGTLYALRKDNSVEVQLFVIREMKGSEFPKNFNFAKSSPILAFTTASPKQALEADGTVDATAEFYIAQLVTGDIDITGIPTAPKYEVDTIPAANVATDIVSVKDSLLRYWSYSGTIPAAETEKDWAGVNVNVGNGVGTGSRVPGTFVAPVLPYTLVGSPKIQSQANKNIEINTTAANHIAAIPGLGTGANQWYFNERDGYFYYLGKLGTGDSTVNLMESIIFPSYNKDASFSVASYDLWIGLESIPATTEALSAASNEGAFAAGGTNAAGTNSNWQSNGSGWGLLDETTYKAIATPTDAQTASYNLWKYFDSIK